MDFVKGLCPGCVLLAREVEALRKYVQQLDADHIIGRKLLRNAFDAEARATCEYMEELRERIALLEGKPAVADQSTPASLLDELIPTCCGHPVNEERNGA